MMRRLLRAAWYPEPDWPVFRGYVRGTIVAVVVTSIYGLGRLAGLW